jgi:hypothetical protein
MVDLFCTPAVKVTHAVNTVDDPGVVALIKFLIEMRAAEEVVAAPRTMLVFVA